MERIRNGWSAVRRHPYVTCMWLLSIYVVVAVVWANWPAPAPTPTQQAAEQLRQNAKKHVREIGEQLKLSK